MAEHRPFPPSPRRRALARGAGLTATSPLLVGGVACAGALVALSTLGDAATARVAAWMAAAMRGASDPHAAVDALGPRGVLRAVLELATPLLAAAAIIAILAHLAQSRAVWMPRRSLAGAPVVPRRRGVIELAGAAAIGGVAVGWLWLVAPRLAALAEVPLAGALLVASALATFAIAWVVIGAGDALVRHHALATALHMTAREKREDDRLAGADPRWRSYRAGLRATSRDPALAVAGATLLLLGDDVAVAVAWDPIHRPIPTRVAAGHGPRATQLLGLARRHDVRVHRDPALAATLDGIGVVPERHWPRLAEIVAAVKRADAPR